MVAHRDTSRVEACVDAVTQAARTFPRRLQHACDEINSLQSPRLLDFRGSNVVKGRTMPARVHHHDQYDRQQSPLQFVGKIRLPKDEEIVGRIGTAKKVLADSMSASTCHVTSPDFTDNLDSTLELYCGMRATW